MPNLNKGLRAATGIKAKKQCLINFVNVIVNKFDLQRLYSSQHDSVQNLFMEYNFHLKDMSDP